MADRIPDITDDATFFRSTRLSFAISLVSSPTLARGVYIPATPSTGVMV